MINERVTSLESAFLRPDDIVVIKGLLNRFHALTLGEAIEPEVRPQRTPQKPDTIELEQVVVQERDVGASTSISEIGPGLLPGVSIKLMVAGQVNHRHRPICECVNCFGAVVDVAREHEHIRTWCRFDDAGAREA